MERFEPLTMYNIKQNIPSLALQNVPGETKKVMAGAGLPELLQPGNKVAITVGSRGIKYIAKIIEAIVDSVKAAGAIPFLFAAMGSHGGGTPEGQLSILSSLGLTAENTGALVVASGECVSLGSLSTGVKVLVNSRILEFDKIIVVNRVKPHTSFHGPAESGLQKMLAIGLGGPFGAQNIHSLGPTSMSDLISETAGVMLGRLPVVLGLAILEDAHEDTMKIVAVKPRDFAPMEKKLLQDAYRVKPSLPFDDIDILIVDEMGKIFSGTGMDTNVIGRLYIEGLPEPAAPRVKRIVVLDLAEGGHGNANGIGLADFTTKRLLNKISFDTTYFNVLSTTFIKRAMLPLIMEDDRTALSGAIKSLGRVIPQELKIARIKNTLHLTNIQVSPKLASQLKESQLNIEINRTTVLDFDSLGNIVPF